MRRLLSLALLLVFSLPLILPALALAQGPDANLPLCCRRNGAHHCAMLMHTGAAPASGTNLSAVPQSCPAYPALVAPLRHIDLASPVTTAAFAEFAGRAAMRPRDAVRSSVALNFSPPQRGPPLHRL